MANRSHRVGAGIAAGSRHTEASEAVLSALDAIGVTGSTAVDAQPGAPSLEVQVPGRPPATFEVRVASKVGPREAQALLSQPGTGDTAVLVVADQISESEREGLAAAGVSWFDRRGRIHLEAPAFAYDRDVPSAPRWIEHRREKGIRGRAGIAFACAALLVPDRAPVLRQVARDAGLAVSSVSEAAASIRRAGLADDAGRATPDLFWALADAWHPRIVNLRDDPRVAGVRYADRLGVFGDPSQPGWAVTGAAAAMAWGAPVVVGSGAPVNFYVPDEVVLARATRYLGTAPAETAACSIAVAPVSAACAPRFEPVGASAPTFAHLRFTHPLFVALELANDPSRGREVLDAWTPPGDVRVW